MTDFHVFAGAEHTIDRPHIRRITLSDVGEALRKGVDDFRDKPSHIVFLALIYPIMGVVLARWSSGEDTLQLIYPLMSGFALIGPFAAIGLYEISRRRELGMDTSWRHALDIRRSPSIPGIAFVGLMLVALFVAWLLTADAIYKAVYLTERPTTITGLLADVFSTSRGWTLILIGNAVGFLFAAAALVLTLVAFPMLLDRDCGAVAAIETSVRAALANPVPVAGWGLIVAVALVLGSLPLFAGLAVVMPVLGHSTWHLYRVLVAPGRGR